MNLPSFLQATTFNQFILRACAAILLLRLLIFTLFPESFIYISEALSNLLIAGLIFLLALIVICKKLIFKESFIRTPLDLPVLILLLSGFLSLLHTVDFSLSFNFLCMMTSSIVLFYILSDLLRDSKAMKTFFSYFMICIVVVILFALWEYFVLKSPEGQITASFGPLIYKRIGSIFHLPNVLAGFLILCFPLMWAAFVLTSNILHKRLLTFAIALYLMTFFLTFAFLCSLNFIITTCFLAPFVFKEWSKKPQYKIAFASIVLCISIFFIMIVFIRHDFSLSSRWEYLKTAFLLIKDHPWIGTGLATFDIVSRKYVTNPSGFSAYVHNSYLQLWVEAGILGLISILLLVGLFVKNAYLALRLEQDPIRRTILIAFVWAISVLFVDNLSNFTILRPDISIFGWTALAGFCALINSNKENLSLHKSHSTFLVGLFTAIILLLYLIVQISLSLLYFQKGSTALLQNNYSSALSYFEKAQKLDSTNFHYPSSKATVYIRKYFVTHNPSDLTQAQENLKEAARLSPHTAKTYAVLSSIAREQGNEKQAQDYLAQAGKLSPLAYSH